MGHLPTPVKVQAPRTVAFGTIPVVVVSHGHLITVSLISMRVANPSSYSYGHLPVITGYFNGIIHSINGVFLVLITNKWP